MVTADEILKQELHLLNATDLLKEIEWFSNVLDTRLKLYFDEEAEHNSIYKIEPPAYEEAVSVFAEFINFYKLNFSERVVLILALLPHIAPNMLDKLFGNNKAADRGYTAFGGIKGSAHSGFLPTGETALFILAGNNLNHRFKVQELFNANHIFKEHNILHIAAAPGNEPFFSGQLLINEEYVDFFTGGRLRKPLFGANFPAKRVTTNLEWNDLVLDAHTARQLNDIKIWLEHGNTLMNEWEMNKRLKPGFKALFYGPPGTGKTLTAALLGKLANLDVYRVDLSMVVSKYIGETEKNLEKVFEKAEHKNWILFFDEADALFGKRTSVSDAHDKYANQEIAYLLQRLEDYNGLVILSSNMRGNVDEAFGRRLQGIIHFPVPKYAQRLQLWQQSFSTHTKLADDVDLHAIAERFEMAGGSVINVVQYASLMALHRKENIIKNTDIMEGIKREYLKEGKTI